MEIQKTAVARCSLEEFLTIDHSTHSARDEESEVTQAVLECFVGKRGDCIAHVRPPGLAHLCKELTGKELGIIRFTHGELFLRFSRIHPTAQNFFIEDACSMLLVNKLDCLEIAVKWRWRKSQVRHIKVEMEEYNHPLHPLGISFCFSLI